MKLTRFLYEKTAGWGLLDEGGRDVWTILGDLRAWGPLIANGAGVCALPRSGRRVPLSDVELLAPVEAKGSIHPTFDLTLDATFVVRRERTQWATAYVPLVVAVVGAPLTGRRNPLRSVFGYSVGLTSSDPECGAAITIAPCLTSRDQFGDDAPELGSVWEEAFGCALQRSGRARDLQGQLARLDEATPLRAGDTVITPMA